MSEFFSVVIYLPALLGDFVISFGLQIGTNLIIPVRLANLFLQGIT
jgi:hypothetical protein